jgi:hypothetical protein
VSALPARTPVSIVCVANDIGVREGCLDRSIADHRAEAPATEYIPIDNCGGAFASAGAALNHGASRARHAVVVFVHQDVYLHSLTAIEEVAAMLVRRDDIGVHGAVGIAADGRIIGRIRDRVVLVGEPSCEPACVDSLDEVLFMVRRATILEQPLAEEADLAWHAYAVEYGLRMRAQGRLVTAGSIPLTHNSLSVNLERLDSAHRAVAIRYPSALPLRTTCGVITAGERRRGPLASQRWRYRWLRESLVAHAARRAIGGGPVVLSDIRHDVDDAIAGTGAPLEIVNCDGERSGTDDRLQAPVEFMRGAQRVSVTSMALSGVTERLESWRPGEALLITNLSVADLRLLRTRLPARRRLVGYHENVGCWVLLGDPAARVPGAAADGRRSTPFGMARPRPA